MVIKSTSMNVSVDIVKISEVEPHEKYDLKRFLELKQKILREGFLDQPLIVDKDIGMILDGTHRFHILNEIGVKYIPVVNVSYLKDNVVVGSWYRLFNNMNREKLRVVVNDRIVKRLKNTGKLDRIYIYENGIKEALYVKELYDVPSAIEYIDRVNRRYLIDYLHSIRFEDLDGIVVGYDPPEKRFIVKRFNEGLKFPVKFTRHMVPYRVVNLRFPLKNLYSRREAYRYIDHINLSYLKSKIYLEENYEERIYIAGKRS